MSAAEAAPVLEYANGGAPPRHVDAVTAELDRLARSWLDVQQTRKALAQRELDDAIVSSFLKGEQQLSRALTKTLRRHMLWPWLSQFPGLGGAHVALMIGLIGDPRRFPGQRCSEGHYLPPLYAPGSPCPIAEVTRESVGGCGDGAQEARADDKTHESESRAVCPGVMLPPRTGTGVRSLWHWAGLHVVDGHAPRKRKGVQADWQPRARTSVMQIRGIADQIVRHGVRVDKGTGARTALHKYGAIYLETKARLLYRVADMTDGLERPTGGAILLPAERRSAIDRSAGGNHLRAAGCTRASETVNGRPLRLYEADRIARKVAAKAFLGDLLTEWKGLES